MSGHGFRHPGPGRVPPPPPRLSRPGSGRNSRRSRSRSPRSEHPVKMTRYAPSDRDERDRGHGKGHSHRRSRSPPQNSANDLNYGLARTSQASSAAAAQPTNFVSHQLQNDFPHLQQSISLIQDERKYPIIRRILDPESVKIPRRFGEGNRPIFDREELKEGMRLRFAAMEEDNSRPRQASPAHLSKQTVIALIRDDGSLRPVREDLRDRDRRVDKKESEPGPSKGRASSSSSRPSQPRPRSFSPRERRMRDDRDKGFVDRKEGRGDFRPRSREDLRETISGRSKDRHPPHQHQHHERQSSPVRILRDRPTGPTRSMSRTPPPMPPQVRRQIVEERERNRDLRNKLSRPPGRVPHDRFEHQHNMPDKDFGSGSRGRGFGRGRGGFRGGRDGNRHHGVWRHDKYEEDGDIEAAS